MKKVYIIWERYPFMSDMFPNMQDQRKLIDIHDTMEGAIMAEGLLVRSMDQYYSIEIRELKE